MTNQSVMLLLRITAAAICVASLLFLAKCSQADEDRRQQHRNDMKLAYLDGSHTRGRHKDDMRALVTGSTYSRAVALENLLKSARAKGDNSKRLLGVICSLRQYLFNNPEKECDLILYNHIESIVWMSDKYFEGLSVLDRMIRMLVFKLHDAFTTNCVQKLKSDLKNLYKNNGEQLAMLNAYGEFLKRDSGHLVEGSHADDPKSILDKLASNGGHAWFAFPRIASGELKAKNPKLASKTGTMPMRKKMAVEFEFMADNTCILLSQKKRFIAFIDEVSSLARRLSFGLVEDESMRHDFQRLQKYVAMYKICMQLKELSARELVEKV